MKHRLELDSIEFNHGLHRVLQSVYMCCSTGEIVGLLGRNGCGKSSLMKIVFGTLQPTMKSIRIDGTNILSTNISKGDIRYLPQQSMIPGNITIAKAFKLCRIDIAICISYFPWLETLQFSRIEQLSYGEKRIVEMCLVLHAKSLFVLLDEPFSYVSPVANEQLVKMILEIKKTKGILITDHAYRYITAIADHIYLLKDGSTKLLKDNSQLQILGYLPAD